MKKKTWLILLILALVYLWWTSKKGQETYKQINSRGAIGIVPGSGGFIEYPLGGGCQAGNGICL